MKILMFVFFLTLCTQAHSKNTQQSIGFYSKGKLSNASKLGSSSKDWKELFPVRNRSFANDTLIEAIKKSAYEIHQRSSDSERLQVSDFSALNGGKLGGHASHQNGLDVDVVYLRYDRTEQEINGNRGLEEKFVKDSEVTSNFDLERNWNLIQQLVTDNDVNRIFVDEAIKDLLCKVYQDETNLLATEVLRRLRPWPSHDDHLHLRLKCPVHQISCEFQDEPPVGDSCFVKISLADEVGP